MIQDNVNNSSHTLNQAIQEYRENRETLVDIHSRTKEEFLHITTVLKSKNTELLECVNIDNLSEVVRELGFEDSQQGNTELYGNGHENDEAMLANKLMGAKLEIDNPAIAIIGQVKAGKSTLVNSILQKNVVPQAYDRCTGRLARLTYSDKGYVELVDVDGTVTKRKNIRKSKIPNIYLKLKEDERNDLVEIRKLVKAGINSQFLKNGIDVIDTPGLNEITLLSNLSKDMIKNILPVMIYVIDGRLSVTQTDISDLLELKNTVPNLQIIYFITKLDIDEVSENRTDDPIRLALCKMKMAFEKLQYNNLIPPTFKSWNECDYFHGASLYGYMDYHAKKINQESTFHFEQFQKFESSLGIYLLRNFENKIYEACDVMTNFQMDVLTKIIKRAGSLADFNQENLTQIANMRSVEEDLFRKIKSVITESKRDLIRRLVLKLKEESRSILNPITDLDYPGSLGIPESGMVIDKVLIEKCQNHIMTYLIFGLENIVRQFVEDELFRNYLNEIERDISRKMSNMQTDRSEGTGNSPYKLCLKRILILCYKFNFAKSSNLCYRQANIVVKLIDIILRSIKSFFWKICKIKKVKGCVDVRNPNWKSHQANMCLQKCDYNSLAEHVCRNLIHEFENKHNTFVVALENEETFMKKKILISADMKKDITNKTPNFTELLMRTLAVKGRYMLRDIEKHELIGRGTQYAVYRCIWNGKEIAKKSCKLAANQLYLVAEEVYYSYLFEHPRLLSFIGISIIDSKYKNCKKISIYTPKMNTDVLKYLQNNTTTLKTRLLIGLQTAEALQYLHKQEIMHRDLKLANILLDEDNNVYLADYGCCKALCLSHNTLLGTPVHMAPEITKNEFYDYKIDIYSFGILLWYLAEGKGNHPQFAKVSERFSVLWATAGDGIRPERLPIISDELWNLMSICWDKYPSVRPSIDFIITKLKEIIEQ